MGGWIGYGVAKYAPERFNALVIGASHPYARSLDNIRQPLYQSPEAYLENALANAPDIAGFLDELGIQKAS